MLHFCIAHLKKMLPTCNLACTFSETILCAVSVTVAYWKHNSRLQLPRLITLLAMVFVRDKLIIDVRISLTQYYHFYNMGRMIYY